MKHFAVLILLGLCGAAYCRPGQKYTTKYDNIDLDAIIRNDRLMRNYIDCLMERKKCTPDGAELKRKFVHFSNFVACCLFFKCFLIFLLFFSSHTQLLYGAFIIDPV